jgi:hypothetical protein
MSAARPPRNPDQMRAEYNFAGGVRGKYATRFAQGSNVVVLAPDVAAVFKTARAVNAALRTQLRQQPARLPGRRRPLNGR